MADEGFKHITVSPEPEEDVVIYAGAKTAPVSEPAPEPAPAPAPIQEADFEAEPAPAQTPAPASALLSEPRKSRAEEADDALDAGPMPLAQRIVIAVAVILVIVAVVYILGFLR